jgi:hypothetical protein
MDSALDILLKNAHSMYDHAAYPGKKIYGVVSARVLSVYDDSPQKRHLQGYVQVWFPWLQDFSDQKLIKPWARMCMGAGGRGYVGNAKPNAKDNAAKKEGAGFYTPPTVGDEVLCAFEQGDIHRPYILGTLWNGNDTVPMVSDVTGRFAQTDTVKSLNFKKANLGPPSCGHSVDGENHAPLTYPDLKSKEKVGSKDGGDANRLWYWRSRSGHLIIFDDSESSPKVIVTTARGKERIVLDQAKGKVQIVSGSWLCAKPHSPKMHEGDCTPLPTMSMGGDQEGAVSNDAIGSDRAGRGDIEILAKNRVWIKARKVNITSSHNTDVQVGAHFNLRAAAQATISSGFNLNLNSNRGFNFTTGEMPPFLGDMPPFNAPAAQKGSPNQGEVNWKTWGKMLIWSMGLVSKDIVIQCIPLGAVKITAMNQVFIVSLTEKVMLNQLTGTMMFFCLGSYTCIALGSHTTIALGGINRITPGNIMDLAGGNYMCITGGNNMALAGSMLMELVASMRIALVGAMNLNLTGGLDLHLASLILLN